jgi:hypothetical protein
MMRRVFSQMEKAQSDFLSALNLSPFDPRLRYARSRARDLFERTWPIALQKEVVANEREAAHLYMHCLVYALNQNRISIPDQAWSKDGRMMALLKEKSR